MTEAELIQDVANLVGGTQRLADLVRVSRRNILRYANGQNWVPRGVWGLIEELLAERAGELAALRGEVALARAAAEQHARERTAEREGAAEQ